MNILSIHNCSPHKIGASMELSRIIGLERPTLMIMYPSSTWALVFSGHSLEDQIDTAKARERNIPLVRIWSSNQRYYGSVCPRDSVCWCLHTPKELYSSRHLYQSAYLATAEAFRGLGINTFVKSPGYAAIQTTGGDRIISAPPAVILHDQWYTTLSDVWWSVDIDDMRVLRTRANKCIMQHDRVGDGLAGASDTATKKTATQWGAVFGECLANRLGLRATPYSLDSAALKRLDVLSEKLQSPMWIEHDVHPEIV